MAHIHRIYFENRCIVICPVTDAALTDPNSIEYHPGNSFGMHDLVAMFKSSPNLSKIYIPAEDTEDMYKRVCSEFKEVNAAGGLVSNRRGDFLLISRYGLWDLPKGHQEAGEDIEVTALREVSEETGINKLILRGLICITDHCYLRNDIWHLKHTWWYDMLYTDPVDLTPQREEDITTAAWVAKSGLAACLTNTFPSIQEVFREARV